MQRIMRIAIVALTVIALPLGMIAQPGKGGHDLGRMKKALDLTEQQTTQIKEILKDAKASRPAVKEMTKEERQQAVQAHRDAVAAKINAVLTAEQQTKFKALKDEARERMQEHRGKRHGRD